MNIQNQGTQANFYQIRKYHNVRIKKQHDSHLLKIALPVISVWVGTGHQFARFLVFQQNKFFFFYRQNVVLCKIVNKICC